MSRKALLPFILLVALLLPAYDSPAANYVSRFTFSAPCPSPYLVRPGDTLTRIARNCGTTVAALQSANGLSGDLIRAGQQLTIPGAAAGPAPPAAQPDPKVVIAVVDGWRYEDTYGDPSHQNIPHVWNDLRPLGAWHSRIYNLGLTSTAPGHAAILGGAWQPIANDGSGRPTAPTLFEYYRKATGAPAGEAVLAFNGSEAGKAAKWAYSSAPGYGAQYGAQMVHAEGLDFDDAGVLGLALGALAGHPHLMLIAFPAVDEFGHAGTFEEYLQSIRTVDEAIWRLWNALQADPFYAGQTTLFVTNDHGRRLDDFRTHGGPTESEQHVTLLTLGPRTPAGLHLTARRTLVDIAPTVGRLMGFNTPLARGSVMWEIIQGN